MAVKKSKVRLKNEKIEKKSLAVPAKNSNTEKTQNDVFPIVGIGASAGGLEAYITFLKNLPLNTDMGFVIVQHQDPTHESALTELLTKATKLPVKEVTNGIKVRPNNIYVMPPNTNMLMRDGVLRLDPRTAGRGLHLPIDSFFQSLAEFHKTHAVGVLLSGTASDGTLGLKAIKAAGGITFAQDEKSAKYNGMPQHAIDAGVVDFVMPPDQIATEIGELARHPVLKNGAIIEVKEHLNDTALHQDEALNSIFRILKKFSAVNFENYKPSTIIRRISRRMLLQRVETLSGYVDYLKNNQKEVSALYEDILINVTNFFRDPETFEVLKLEIFPKLIKPIPGKTLRVWVPACSTGEEVYSLAICLLEYLGEHQKNMPAQIFGTDVSDSAIEKARSGQYSYDIQKDVSSDRLRRFFTKTERGYQINKMVRDVCIFARHNVTQNSPFSKMDLISCRNLLIYFGSALQRKVIPVFHYALNQNGYLLLGNTEDIGGFADFFFPADRKHRIFSKKLIPSRVHLDFSETTALEHPSVIPKQTYTENISERDVLKEGDRLILSKYAPPSVIVDENLNILHFRGKTGRYLEPSSGIASLNILKMAKEGFAMELRNAVNRVKREDNQVIVKGLLVKVDRHTETFNVEVTPFSLPRSSGRFFLISFHEEIPEARAKKGRAKRIKVLRQSDHNQVARLEEELSATREYLQSIIEEQEATNEELRAANEEILSNNEELQSTNEEMETAREELQSANEELTTVNEELHNRNAELSMTIGDLNNLFSSVHIPTIIVGPDLRIRRFTPMAEKVLNMIPSDLGRIITDINLNIDEPNFAGWIIEVIDSMNQKELEIQDRRGRWYRLQIRPYKTVDNRIDGAVIVLIDIDMFKRSMADISKYKQYCEAIVDNAHESLIILSGSLEIMIANRAFYQTFRIPEDATGKNLKDLGDPWSGRELQRLLREVLPQNKKLENYKIEFDFPKVGRKALLLNASVLFMEGTGEQNILLAIQDLAVKF
ncbi:PAS domain-containing protein [bacterium]|nr:PAS domain-containing protein [bacterium]